MRTMVGLRTCGSLRSMRHVTTRPYEDKSVPHLTLYVQQMNKTKLIKEREVLSNRLSEIDKQINNIDSLVLSLRPKLGLPEPVKRGRPRKGDGGEEARRQGSKEARKIKRMKVTF